MGHLAVGEVALGHLGPGGHVHHHVAEPLGPVDLGEGGSGGLKYFSVHARLNVTSSRKEEYSCYSNNMSCPGYY